MDIFFIYLHIFFIFANRIYSASSPIFVRIFVDIKMKINLILLRSTKNINAFPPTRVCMYNWPTFPVIFSSFFPAFFLVYFISVFLPFFLLFLFFPVYFIFIFVLPAFPFFSCLFYLFFPARFVLTKCLPWSVLLRN